MSAALVISLLALGVSGASLWFNFTNAKRQRAFDTLKKYIELEIPLATKEDDKEDLRSTFLLFTARELLEAHPNDEGTKTFLIDEFRYWLDHYEDFRAKYPGYILKVWGSAVDELIVKAITEGPHK